MTKLESGITDLLHNLSPALRRACLATIAEIDSIITQPLSRTQFMDRAVHVIHSQFDVYAANLYIIEDEKWATLRAGTSELAPAALKHGHKLALDGNSLVSLVIRSGETRAALPADDQLPIRFPSAIEPNVHSEIVLPLTTQEMVIIGALDIQGSQHKAFGPEESRAFSALARHIANILHSHEWRE